MRKAFSLLFGLLLFVTAAQAQHTSIFIGGDGAGAGGQAITDQELGSAGIRQAFGFLPADSKTISEVSIYIPYKDGTLGATDGTLAIFSSTAGHPNSSLTSATFNPNSAGWKRVSISQAVTAGTQYWFVISNTNGTPASNYFGVRIMPDWSVGTGAGSYGSDKGGAAWRKSSDSGSTWNDNTRSAAAAYRVKFSDNSYVGYTAEGGQYGSTPIDAADRIYSTNEVGNKITMPADAKFRLKCIAFRVGTSAGTPTGNLRYRLYTGSTLTATTASLVGDATTNAYIPLCFSSVQELSASTSYRFVIGETTQSDTSSDSFGPHRIDWDSDSSSQALKPFSGTLSKTVCSGSCSGGTWTDTSTSFYAMSLVSEFGDEFGTQSAGGLIQSPNTSGGSQ